MNVKVITCHHTKEVVLFDTENNICLHNDTVNDDIKEVKAYKEKYQGNATAEDLAIGCLHSVGGYWVSNEGTKKQPNYHVWVPGITHSTCDSAYNNLSLAVCRCNYLAKNKIV